MAENKRGRQGQLQRRGGGEIKVERRAGQGRAGQLQVRNHTVGQNPISLAWKRARVECGPCLAGWPLHAVASWVGAAESSGSGASEHRRQGALGKVLTVAGGADRCAMWDAIRGVQHGDARAQAPRKCRDARRGGGGDG